MEGGGREIEKMRRAPIQSGIYTPPSPPRFNCQRCLLGRQMKAPPTDSDTNSDLSQWHHCSVDKRGVEDMVLKKVWDPKTISFVFHHKSHEKRIETV